TRNTPSPFNSQIHLSLKEDRVTDDKEFKSFHCSRSTPSRTDLQKETSMEEDLNLNATEASLSVSRANKRGNLTRRGISETQLSCQN
ncbi:hypothetical protein Tco_1086509, partial [Tanacetum coccineum]